MPEKQIFQSDVIVPWYKDIFEILTIIFLFIFIFAGVEIILMGGLIFVLIVLFLSAIVYLIIKSKERKTKRDYARFQLFEDKWVLLPNKKEIPLNEIGEIIVYVSVIKIFIMADLKINNQWQKFCLERDFSPNKHDELLKFYQALSRLGYKEEKIGSETHFIWQNN